ncbi:MAG: Gfo/Idh/MocA family protein [Geminicoccaceae bacterium]
MTFRLGWVGCGRQAREMLLPHLAVMDGVTLAAIADIDADARAAVATGYGVAECFADYRDLLQMGGLDGVGMAVGPAQHREIALGALAANLPVFMEKPPAADLAGAKKIAEASKTAKKPVLVGFMKRFSSGNKIAKNLLEGADFGQRLGILASYMTAPGYFETAPDDSAFFLHHGIHYVDLLPWLMGSAITEISARRVEPRPGRFLIHFSLQFASGAIGSLAMGTVQSRGAPVEFVQIMGDHRRIEITNVSDVTYARDPPFKVDDPGATLEDGADTLSWTPNMTVAANEDHKGYRALLEASLDAMRGQRSTAPTIEDGVRAMATLEQMRQALGHRR